MDWLVRDGLRVTLLCLRPLAVLAASLLLPLVRHRGWFVDDRGFVEIKSESFTDLFCPRRSFHSVLKDLDQEAAVLGPENDNK